MSNSGAANSDANRGQAVNNNWLVMSNMRIQSVIVHLVTDGN